MTLNEVQVDCTGYELAIGSINGYRKFSIDRLGRLRGLHHDQVWKPGENVATCRARRHSAHCGYGYGIPCKCEGNNGKVFHSESCPCGFYAFLDCTERRYGGGLRKRFIVGGVIEGYGKTVIGRKGFRCEKASILCVVIPWRKRLRRPRTSRLLRRNYPDLTILASKRVASRRYDVSLKTAQTPETDPDFWTRP